MNVKTIAATCAIACSLLLFSCDNQIGKKTTSKPTPQAKDTQKPAQTQANKPAQKPSMMDDVNSVINYGTGATAIQAKKKMQNKLQNAQDQHNKQMDDALK